jgi:hypothetical protein
VVRSIGASNRTDKGDVLDGWVAMACTGGFEGKKLCLPGIGLKLAHQPGDVVFFCSNVLEYFVASFTGFRNPAGL